MTVADALANLEAADLPIDARDPGAAHRAALEHPAYRDARAALEAMWLRLEPGAAFCQHPGDLGRLVAAVADWPKRVAQASYAAKMDRVRAA